MPVFKYYRPDFYFEKSIRYDEIYFSSNEEMNDPLDLTVTINFSDNIEGWKKLLAIELPYSSWKFSNYLNVFINNFASDLNDIFKNTYLENQKTIDGLIKSKKDKLEYLFIKYINKSIKSGFKFTESNNDEDISVKANTCIHYLSSLLCRGSNQRFYACSFSKTPLEPMMWAHYADGFKGCVIIYNDNDNDNDNENLINLKENLKSNDYKSYDYAEVKYLDREVNTICILEQIFDSTALNSKLLTKNIFWSYEKELRVLLSETFTPSQSMHHDDIPKSNKARIFHHDPYSIKGVIFGARCSNDYKSYIEGILGEKNSYNSNVERFLSFETDLTLDGKVVIKTGSICNSMRLGSSQVGKEILEGNKLNKVLAEFNII